MFTGFPDKVITDDKLQGFNGVCCRVTGVTWEVMVQVYSVKKSYNKNTTNRNKPCIQTPPQIDRVDGVLCRIGNISAM